MSTSSTPAGSARSARPSRPTNPLALAVLAYLVQRPMHPYELSTTLRDHGDARSIKFNHGSLYMVFKQLDKAGLIRPLATSREGARPERTTYELTDTGRAELHDWLADLVRDPEWEYPRFVTALSLIGVLPPDEVVELLTERLEALGRARSEIETLLATSSVHPLFTIEEEYRLALLHTEVAFIESLIDRITDSERGWAAPWVEFHDIASRTPASDPATSDQGDPRPDGPGRASRKTGSHQGGNP